MRFTKSLLAAAALAATLPGAALAVVYDCKVTRNDPSGWVPERVIIQHNPATDEVIVNDPLIQHFLGRTTAGALDVNNSKRTTFKWSIDGTTNRQAQFTRMNYRATIQKGSNALTITGKPLGYTNNYRGSGRCTIRK